jgi:3-hydroxyacyl-[acyl-carrier-protein] dehydratase
MLKKLAPLLLGADVVSRLLPHRRPLLMVDTIEAYEPGPRPTLRAARNISANEAVFEGHFPGLLLWPGIYTIEGMAQTCNLLRVLLGLQEGWRRNGGEAADVLAALRNMDLGFRLQPGYRPEASKRLVALLTTDLADPVTRLGVSTAVEVKFLQPVFAGQRLIYTVTQTHAVESMLRFEVQAEVDGRIVARGAISGAIGLALPGAPAAG